jgi:pSer/pThr/pTyr-binding forkhead associated (FHA) protein
MLEDRPPSLLVVVPDREYFDFVCRTGGSATALTFPSYAPERRFTLTGRQMLIGRRSVSRGVEPEIDLTGPPEDPAVGRSHAMLVADENGSWSIVDLGSVNGTYLNHGPDPIEPDVATPLRIGDQIHVGAWTTLTLR